MSQYPKLTMTDSAIEMIAESQLSGTDLEITKVKIGDGLLPDETDIKAMTDVVAVRMEAPMTSSKNDGKGQLAINFAVGNENLDTGFFAREIGIFAKLTGGEEKLYAYTNAGNKCDWIPDKGTPIDSQVVTATLVIGNAANVVVNIKDNAYALAIELVEHKEDPNAHANMLDKHNSDDHAHPNRLRPPLKRSTTYAKGDIAFHDSLPSWAYLECTQAGTTSDSELSAGAAKEKDIITDGTTKWEVRRLGGSSVTPQPTYFYTSGTYTVPDGVTTIYVSGCAGGGGGSFCGGGGGGESIMRKQISVTPGESISITIGTGGHASSTTGGSASVSSTKIASAGDGGNTVFGNYFTLQGGKGIAYNSSGAETQMPLAGGNGATNGGMCTLLRYNNEDSVFWVGGKGGDSLFGKGGAGGSWSVGYALGSTNRSMNGGDGIGYGSGGGGFGSYYKAPRNYWTGAGAGTNGFIMIEVA